MFNVDEIRKDFPYLDIRRNGKPIVYLDNAATSQKPSQVLDSVYNFYRTNTANPHRGGHFLGLKATEAYESAREEIAKFINANKTEEIIFTRSSTEALNEIAYSYGNSNLKKDDEILISILEHHANLIPWQRVCEKTGAKLIFSYLNDDYSLNYEDLKSKINDKTKIVSITGASNITGEVINLKLIAKWAHENGSIFIADAAQLIGHHKVDVKDIDCDFLVFSGHKMLSPFGIGVLYGKKDILDKMIPFNLGGEMIEYVYEQKSSFAEVPLRFEAGTQNIGGAVGLKSAIDYLNKFNSDDISSYERKLTEYAYDLVKDYPNLQLYYPPKEKAGNILTFNYTDIHPHDVSTIIDSLSNVAVRSGHHCVMPLHTYWNVSSTCRASFSFYNTKEEVEIFAKSLKEVRKVMGL
ncbi:MAG: SufS family cysteine desulfurase [Peptoniphilaceae bacterium]|nr:SufS family cysteine desulfurase [Peptoniphilaceae bacterium]MDD7383170.1 SufS family cysteine desulfurase [Peptoniphilaceae bacterium]MDY3738394.1 SufS family cysteine desulfurase [Peptoniphilaceae bacterium]